MSPSSKIANSNTMQSIVTIIGELKQSQELPDISGDILLKVIKLILFELKFWL